MKVKSTVLKIHPATFDMTGRFLGYPMTPTDTEIKTGLLSRLIRYACERLTDAGFPIFERVEVEQVADEGYYHVTFQNDKGGRIGVQGIMTKPGGWPTLDHGLTISVSVSTLYPQTKGVKAE